MENKYRLKHGFAWKIMLAVLFWITVQNSIAQSGISLSWDKEVGCQVYSVDDRKDNLYLEDIQPNVCLRVCEYSTVVYTLDGLTTNPNTTWIVTGGNVVTEDEQSITVNWLSSGNGLLEFSTLTPEGIVAKQLCIEIVDRPEAIFTVFPAAAQEPISGCVNQTMYFTNQSIANNGSAIVSHYWSFGDGTFSSAENPTHSYEYAQDYEVTLTVTNACNCSHTYSMMVHIEGQGIEIICPSVVCEGQTETYTLSEETLNACGEYYWAVVGGQIIGDNKAPSVTVNWNNVDESGFGYVTFYPNGCSLPCPEPTTIKIPVIQTTGTIQGKNSLCLGEQARYKLPQWPTTQFNWEIIGNAGGTLASVIQTDQRNEVIITPTQTGTITLYATYYNTLLGCGGTATFTITVNNPMPITGVNAVCINTSETYSTTAPVNWSLKNNLGAIVGNATNTNMFNYNFTTAGTFVLTVSGTGICEGQSKYINVLPSLDPPVLVSFDPNVCSNAPYTFTIDNPDPNSQYFWEVVNGNPISSLTGTEFTATFNGNGQIKVRRERIAPINCSSITVIHPISILQINAEITDSVANNPVTAMTACSNNYFTYKAINNNGTTGIYNDPESSFEWSIIPQSAGSITAGQGTNTVTVLWNNVTTTPTPPHALSLTINKCSETTTINQNVTVTPVPVITVTGNNSVCSGVNITFTVNSNTPLNPNTVINWTFSNGEQQNGSPGVFTITKNFNNAFGVNIGYTATATVTNPNSCVGIITAVKNFTVTPGSNANASISNGGNSYCEQSSINTTITASTSAGATVIWYKNSISNPVGSGASLTITPSLGFGSYFFVASLNGCKTTSNSITIYQNCNVPIACVVTPTPTVTVADSVNCGLITLQGTPSGTPLYTNWTLIGPGPNFTNQPSNNGTNQYAHTATKAGVYLFIFAAYYAAGSGQVCKFTATTSLTVPYVPIVKTNAVCNGNATFNVTLSDNSDFLTTVTNKVYRYEIGSTASGPWTTVANWSSNSSFILTNLAAGNYFIRHSIRGSLNGVPQNACSVVVPLILETITTSTILFDQPECYNKSVTFGINNPLTDYTYVWNFDGAVQNTNPEPSRVFNPTLAGNPNGVEVSVTITNKFGCQKTLYTTVYIPARCYFGEIISDVLSVCKGESIELSYDLGVNECTPVGYILMNGTQTVTSSATNSFLVDEPGFYSIKVINGNGCVYQTPNVISPLFINKPTLTLISPTTVCQGSPVTIQAVTNADEIEWLLDNVVKPEFANLETIQLANLGVDAYSVTVNVTDSTTGCSNTKTITFNVIAAPEEPTIATPVLLNCDAYQIELTASISGSGNGTFYWSDGQTGPVIVVNQGGPYMVTYTNEGGCSKTAQIDVPKSPEAYLWIFPTGCYDACDHYLGSILGPNIPMHEWQWNVNSLPDSSGTNSFPASYTLYQPGSHSLSLNSGLCAMESEAMDLQVNNCENCPIEDLTVVRVTSNENGLCWFTVELSITSSWGTDFTAILTNSNQEVVIAPTSLTITPGTNTYFITVIPLTTTINGSIALQLIGEFSDGEQTFPCIYPFAVEIENCDTYNSRIAVNETTETQLDSQKGSILIYPNPAQNEVNIQFESAASQVDLQVYDLTGRLVANHATTDAKGVWTVNLNTLSSGLYIVVLRENNQVILQKKLQVL